MSNTKSTEKCETIWVWIIGRAEADLLAARERVRKLKKAVAKLKASALRGDPLPGE
jgi:hypothetical protein